MKEERPPGIVWQIRLNIGVALVLAVFGVALVGLFIRFPDNRSEIAFAAATIGGAAALYSAYFASTTLRVHIQRDKQRQSFAILDTLNEEESVRLRTFIEAEKLHNRALSQEDIYQKIVAKSDLLKAVTHVLGLFEDTSIAIQTGYADEVVLYRSLRFMVTWNFDCLMPYIRQERQMPDGQDLYVELEKLANAWKARTSVIDHKPIKKD